MFLNVGDGRVNQTPMLALLHSLFLRLHNNNADGLSKENPSWDDQRVFDEARQLTIAIYQSIIYNEWAPMILGKNEY